MIRALRSIYLATCLAAFTLVTAAVTYPEWSYANAPGGGTAIDAQPSFEVIVTNNKTGNAYPWTVKTFNGEAACKAALGNVQEFLSGVAKGQEPVVEYNAQVDQELAHSVDVLVLYMYQNTGQLPDLSIGCRPAEAKGRPA